MFRRFAIVPFVLVSLLAATASAQTDADRARARGHFERGVSLYESGQHRAALEQFQEAYRIAPHPMVRVNMANCYEELGRPLEAIHHFERFLAEADSASAQQRREVQTAMRRLEGQLGEVRLSVTPDGASVTIDGAETRRSPILDPLRLSAGTHQVVVRMDGYRTETRDVTVAGGGEERVSIRLERAGAAVASTSSSEGAAATASTGDADEPEDTTDEDAGDADTTTASSDETSRSATLADPTGDAATGDAATAEDGETPDEEGGGFSWELRITTPVIIAGAATGGLLLGTIITGAVAVAANSDFDNAVQRSNDPSLSAAERAQASADGRSAADLANGMSITSDVFLIGTIAAAGATAFFVIVEGMDDNQDDADATALRMRAAPMASQNVAGVMLDGQF